MPLPSYGLGKADEGKLHMDFEKKPSPLGYSTWSWSRRGLGTLGDTAERVGLFYKEERDLGGNLHPEMVRDSV